MSSTHRFWETRPQALSARLLSGLRWAVERFSQRMEMCTCRPDQKEKGWNREEAVELRVILNLGECQCTGNPGCLAGKAREGQVTLGKGALTCH